VQTHRVFPKLVFTGFLIIVNFVCLQALSVDITSYINDKVSFAK